MDNAIMIEIVKGGFMLTYPAIDDVSENSEQEHVREVFTSPRKMIQRIKTVLDAVSTVADDSGDSGK